MTKKQLIGFVILMAVITGWLVYVNAERQTTDCPEGWHQASNVEWIKYIDPDTGKRGEMSMAICEKDDGTN